MNLYRYRIVANKEKTKFKLQKKQNFLVALENFACYEQIDKPIEILILAIILLFPYVLIFPLIFVDDAFKEIFGWQDIMEASDPLVLAAKKKAHQEQHQFHHKKQEKFTPFLMDL